MPEMSLLFLRFLLACTALTIVADAQGITEKKEEVCASHFCSNAGTCWHYSGVNGYRCVCSPGFTGLNCQININECASNPCINGQCIDGANSYSCSCYSGWEGTNCNINHNDCFAAACLNGGRCIDGNKTYTCDCLGTGFTGPRCEINIDDCLPNPCKNGAPCQDLVMDYNCKCFDGYYDKNCSSDIQDCTPHKCEFDGLCLERSNQSSYENPSLPSPFNGSFSYSQAAGFVCVCPIGTSGDTCEINPCLIPGTNQSVCVHASSCTDGLASFTCHCLPGYEGPTCSVDINECELFGQPCQNGAVCKDLVADFACTKCPAGFGGKNCSVELPSFSFGVGGKASFASFTTLSNTSSVHGDDSWTIELRLLTLSPGAFLMLFGDLSDLATIPKLLATIDSSGRLVAQLLHSNGSLIATLTSSDSVATGSFVSVTISVSISGRELSLAVSSAVRSASLSSASPLSQLSGQLIIGGFRGAPAPPTSSLSHSGRSKRSIATIPASVASHLPPNITAFRGVIAAPRLNEKSPLILGSVASSLIDSLPRAVVASISVEVVTGIVKENPCEAIRPCENGASCIDGFYYSYSCTCHPGFSGKNCSVDISDCNPNPCGADSYCLERSKAAIYSNPALPQPFSGSFSYSSATGFVCLPKCEIVHFSEWTIAALCVAAFAIGVVLSIAVFLLLLFRHRNGGMSLGYFERQCHNAKNTEDQGASRAPGRMESEPSTHGAHVYVTADKPRLSNSSTADVYGMGPYDEANDADKNQAYATAGKAVNSASVGIALVESAVGLSAYDEILDVSASQQQQHGPKPHQRGAKHNIGTDGALGRRPEQLTVDEVGSGDEVSV